MLRPTIYIAPKDLCLVAIRWLAAEAEIRAIKDQPTPKPDGPRAPSRAEAGSLVAV